MENRVFYIKYLNYQPVSIETHFIGDTERRRPLHTVGQLIGAYKQALPSKLGSTDLDELTLHLPDGSAIPGNILLATIQETVINHLLSSQLMMHEVLLIEG